MFPGKLSFAYLYYHALCINLFFSSNHAKTSKTASSNTVGQFMKIQKIKKLVFT